MKRHEQISLLQRALMDTHQPRVSKARLMEILQCSDSTVKRLIEDLRDTHSRTQRIGHVPDPLGPGVFQVVDQLVAGIG